MELLAFLLIGILPLIIALLSIPIEIHHQSFYWGGFNGYGCDVSSAKLLKVRWFGFYYISHKYDHLKRHPKNHSTYDKFIKEVNRIKKK